MYPHDIRQMSAKRPPTRKIPDCRTLIPAPTPLFPLINFFFYFLKGERKGAGKGWVKFEFDASADVSRTSCGHHPAAQTHLQDTYKVVK